MQTADGESGTAKAPQSLFGVVRYRANTAARMGGKIQERYRMTQIMDVARRAFSPFGRVKVVDIGANPIGGDAPYQALIDNDMCSLYGFEPQLEAYEKLLDLDHPNATYVNAAVGDGESHKLHIYRQDGLSSFFPLRQANIDTLNFSGHELVRTVEIPTVRLDDIKEIDRIDFLKIDTQGAELMILNNGDTKMKAALAVQIEMRFLQLYDGEPGLGKLLDWLSVRDFEFHNLLVLTRFMLRGTRRPGFNRRMKHQVGDGDGLFVRNLTAFDKLTPEEIGRLGALACGLGQSNLGFYCLLHLIKAGQVDPALEADMVAAILA